MLIVPFINCSPNQIARFLRSLIFDPGPVYKRTTLFWATHISLISHQPSATPSVQKFFTMSSKCIFCKQQVRPRQGGLQCDGCLRWQHRTCETGVSQSSYRSAVKTGSSINWFCSTRDVPQAESTRILFSESDWVRTLKRSDYFVPIVRVCVEKQSAIKPRDAIGRKQEEPSLIVVS